jgi:hypothetical protein
MTGLSLTGWFYNWLRLHHSQNGTSGFLQPVRIRCGKIRKLSRAGWFVYFRQVVRAMSERSWPADFDLPDWYKIGTHLSNIISSISIISGLEVVFKSLCIGQSRDCRVFT